MAERIVSDQYGTYVRVLTDEAEREIRTPIDSTRGSDGRSDDGS